MAVVARERLPGNNPDKRPAYGPYTNNLSEK